MTREQAIRETQRRANAAGVPLWFQDIFGNRTLIHPTKPVQYLSGVTNDFLRFAPNGIGLLLTPGCSSARWVASHPAFAVDNGIFGLAKRHQEEKFDAERFYRWIDTLPRTALFVAAPDVLHFVDLAGDGEEVPVGDAAATLAQFPQHAQRIRALGFKVALVGQDGIETMLAEIPWDLVDAIFLGGSDAWKLGAGARALVVEAKARGRHVHMGRANSLKRLEYAQEIGCDTADGTFIQYGGNHNVARVHGWNSELRMTARTTDGGVNPTVPKINWSLALRRLAK